MRERFEKLPHISLVIGFLKFSEDSNDYIRIDDRIDNYALGLVNGAWYAFQEQQAKINAVLQYLDTGDHPLDFSANTIRELLK